MQFSLKLVKITAYARPRKQNVPHYKTSSGTPQRNTSEMSTAKPKTTGPGKLIYLNIQFGKPGKPVLAHCAFPFIGIFPTRSAQRPF